MAVPASYLEKIYAKLAAENRTQGAAGTIEIEQEGTLISEGAKLEAGRVQCALAIGVFGFFWICHEYTRATTNGPYPFRFQNMIESVLFMADIALMTLGFLVASAQKYFESKAIEMAMLVVLIGVLGGIAMYLMFMLAGEARKGLFKFRTRRLARGEARKAEAAARKSAIACWHGRHSSMAEADLPPLPGPTNGRHSEKRDSIVTGLYDLAEHDLSDRDSREYGDAAAKVEDDHNDAKLRASLVDGSAEASVASNNVSEAAGPSVRAARPKLQRKSACMDDEEPTAARPDVEVEESTAKERPGMLLTARGEAMRTARVLRTDQVTSRNRPSCFARPMDSQQCMSFRGRPGLLNDGQQCMSFRARPGMLNDGQVCMSYRARAEAPSSTLASDPFSTIAESAEESGDGQATTAGGANAQGQMKRAIALFGAVQSFKRYLPRHAWSAVALLGDGLGDGGHGGVYLARVKDKDVVVRRFAGAAERSTQSVHSLYNELEALAQLRHPNLLRIVAIIADPSASSASTAGVVLEHVAFSLHALLTGEHTGRGGDRLKPASWANPLLRVLREVAWGLAFLHAKGACHGRLHPRNVLLTHHYHVKLTDFRGEVTKAGPRALNEEGDVDPSDLRWTYMSPETPSIADAPNGVLPSPPPSPPGESIDVPSGPTSRKASCGGRRPSVAPVRRPSVAPVVSIARKSLRRASLSLGRRSITDPGVDETKQLALAFAAADIWAFGCLVAFTATGEPPYSKAVRERCIERGASGYESRRHIVDSARDEQTPLHTFMLSAKPSDLCAQALYELAEKCVHSEAAQRPTAAQITTDHMRHGILGSMAKEGKARQLKAASKRNLAVDGGDANDVNISDESEPVAARGTFAMPKAAAFPAPISFGAGAASVAVVAKLRRRSILRRESVAKV